MPKEQKTEAAKHEELIDDAVFWADLCPPQNLYVEALTPGP